MIKVIDGKTYNTETATCLYSQDVYDNGTYAGSNDIMVTAKGTLFVHYSTNGQVLYRNADIQIPNNFSEWLSGREVTAKELAALAPYNILTEA